MRSARGFSLIETLVSLAITASVTAASLPALAVAARLHRESATETEVAIIAHARLARLASDVSMGVAATGGRLDSAAQGWQVFVDRAGDQVDAAGAAFDVRWRVVAMAAPPGGYLLSVHVVPLAGQVSPITLSLAVPDG